MGWRRNEPRAARSGMAGLVTFTCPSCGAKLRARDDSVGKRIKCPRCSQPARVPAAPCHPTVAIAIKPDTSPGTFAESGQPSSASQPITYPDFPGYEFLGVLG